MRRRVAVDAHAARSPQPDRTGPPRRGRRRAFLVGFSVHADPHLHEQGKTHLVLTPFRQLRELAALVPAGWRATACRRGSTTS